MLPLHCGAQAPTADRLLYGAQLPCGVQAPAGPSNFSSFFQLHHSTTLLMQNSPALSKEMPGSFAGAIPFTN
jgi:hypothetical protein